MKIILAAFFAILALTSLSARAGTPIINLRVGGEISPGVYGEVQFGNAPPPEVINAQPMLVVRQHGAAVKPMYLHVPPGHAKHWARYCHRYNACNRPVYFVKSGRYQPDYRNRHDKGYRNDGRRDHEDRGHGRRDREDLSRDREDRGD